MKRKLSAMSQQYATALKKHLKQGPQGSLQPARELGRRALTMGLETLDVARIHKGALAKLEASNSKDGVVERAKIFFTEAVRPLRIEFTGVELKTSIRPDQVNKMLDRRMANLATTNRSLKQRITRRKTMEKTLRKSSEHIKKLLAESYRLREHFQHLARQVLSSQEGNRKKISHSLQDDIAQTLLGINVRLLALKMEAVVNATDFKNGIASTQRLVGESLQSIDRFARELDIHQSA